MYQWCISHFLHWTHAVLPKLASNGLTFVVCSQHKADISHWRRHLVVILIHQAIWFHIFTHHIIVYHTTWLLLIHSWVRSRGAATQSVVVSGVAKNAWGGSDAEYGEVCAQVLMYRNVQGMCCSPSTVHIFQLQIAGAMVWCPSCPLTISHVKWSDSRPVCRGSTLKTRHASERSAWWHGIQLKRILPNIS